MLLQFSSPACACLVQYKVKFTRVYFTLKWKLWLLLIKCNSAKVSYNNVQSSYRDVRKPHDTVLVRREIALAGAIKYYNIHGEHKAGKPMIALVITPYLLAADSIAGI